MTVRLSGGMVWDAVLLVTAVCMALAGFAVGDEAPEAEMGISGLVLGIVVLAVTLAMKTVLAGPARRFVVAPFPGHREFALAGTTVLAAMLLIMLFGSVLALVLAVVVANDWAAAVCAAAVVVLARASVPHMRACAGGFRAMRRRTGFA